MHRSVASLVLGATVVGIACVDMSAPKGPASISVLQLPSPSVIVGDVMRDSLGAPAPLHIIAYDANGNQVADASAQFFVTDSGAVGHLDATNVLVGDKIGTIHLIGQIGNLQTPVSSVPITVAPTKINAPSPTPDTLRFPVTGDSATSIKSVPLAVTVRGAFDSTAQGFFVRYTLTRAPATVAGSKSPAVYLANDIGGISTVDTSDATGASRNLVVNAKFLADPSLVLGTKIDSVIVTVSLSYKGVAVAGSPITFTVPIKAQ